jgi:hypothetical protein
MSSVGERIIVLGNTGSGKSTLAEALATRLGLPYVELDALFWEPDWQEPDPELFRERVRAATAGGRWVVAGNYLTRTQDILWPQAQSVVYLDLSLPLVLSRGVRRAWARWRNHELLWGTNYEHFWPHLKLWDPKDSLLAFAIQAHRSKRARFEADSADPRWAHVRFVRLRSPAHVARWLDSVAPLEAAASTA